MEGCLQNWVLRGVNKLLRCVAKEKLGTSDLLASRAGLEQCLTETSSLTCHLALRFGARCSSSFRNCSVPNLTPSAHHPSTSFPALLPFSGGDFYLFSWAQTSFRRVPQNCHLAKVFPLGAWSPAPRAARTLCCLACVVPRTPGAFPWLESTVYDKGAMHRSDVWSKSSLTTSLHAFLKIIIAFWKAVLITNNFKNVF